jgi:hypothetical protein
MGHPIHLRGWHKSQRYIEEIKPARLRIRARGPMNATPDRRKKNAQALWPGRFGLLRTDY